MKSFLQKILNVVSMRSLRTRIFVILLVVGIVPSVLTRYAIVSTYEERAVENRIVTVQNQLKILANHLITNNYLEPDERGNITASNEVINAELTMLGDLYEGRVMIINSACKVVKDTYSISQGKTMISEEVIRCLRGISTSNYDREHGYIEMTIPITDTTSDSGKEKILGVMLTSISSNSIIATMEALNTNAWNLLVLMIILIVVMDWFISKLLVRPFERISVAIGEVKAGYSNDPISVPDYAETVHIVDAFNQLQTRMKALDDSREEFVANVSHELKTPMTSIKVLSDSLLDQPNVPVEMYREFMEDIGHEIDRENQIITDLLALVKMDRTNQDMNIAEININNLMEIVLKRLRPIARKKDVELILESNCEVIAEVDEVKMTLIISNLVENAIKYNNDHGWVHVFLDADHQSFTIEVSDSGIGIPEESLNHIYERFYRVDKSHSREIGGTGLGLAITRNAVLLHRGQITLTSTEGEGSCFCVQIPLKYMAAKMN